MLPYELVLCVLQFLEVSDILSICRTCKFLYSVWQDEFLWRLLCKRDGYLTRSEDIKISYIHQWIVSHSPLKLSNIEPPVLNDFKSTILVKYPLQIIQDSCTGMYKPLYYIRYHSDDRYYYIMVHTEKEVRGSTHCAIYTANCLLIDYINQGYQRCQCLQYSTLRRQVMWDISYVGKIESLIKLGIFQLVKENVAS